MSLSEPIFRNARDLSNRLRGRYAKGPIMPNGEPEFGYSVFTEMPDGKPFPGLYVQAAEMIEALTARAEGVAALQQAGDLFAENAKKSSAEQIAENANCPEGWVLVPREPTADMLAAADSAIPRFEEEIDGSRLMGVDGALDAWKAMIAAAPLPQQTALVEQGVEKIIGPHEPAACGEGTVPSPSEPPRSDGWQDIASAPRDGTTIQARIPGHGSDNMIAWISDALDDGNGSCGAWTFVLEDQEPPSCWSDGWCWAVNEDGERSAEPTEWKAAPPPADGGDA